MYSSVHMQKGRFQVLTIASGPSVLDNIAPRLSVSGATVVAERVASPNEAVVALDVSDYDCILYDVGGLPDPALDLKNALAEQKNSTPIIVVSDQLSSNDMVSLLREGHRRLHQFRRIAHRQGHPCHLERHPERTHRARPPTWPRTSGHSMPCTIS